MDKKKQLLISIGLVFLLVLMVMGVSYAAFTFIGSGEKLNTITTGVISMEYKESSNVISINKALPTTDATGKKRLTEGEYFDFTVLSNIKGSTAVNYEIAAEDVTSSTAKKIDGKHIKLYLTKINSDGTETEVMAPKTFKTSSANQYTGKPSGMMSLERNTTGESLNTKYRLRMYVDENYNPQGDGGDLKFSIRINVYGKVTSESMPQGGTLKAYMMPNQSSLPETDFHTAEYKEKITSITTKKDNIVPATALASFDVSDEQNKSVMAYIEDDGTGAGTYKLTIGGRNGIIANESMKNYFLGFTNVKTIDLSNLDTSFTTNMDSMFINCSSLADLNMENFNFSKLTTPGVLFYNTSENIKVSMKNANFENLSNFSDLFRFISSLDLSGANFTGTNLKKLFDTNSYCDLISINLSNAITNDVTDMSFMFSRCDKLKEINLTNFDTSSVTNMASMFYGCTNLEEINVTSFNTSKVTNMSSMFGYCPKLKSLDLSNFNTSKVTNMSSIVDCTSLLYLNMNNFDFSNSNFEETILYSIKNDLKVDMKSTNFEGLTSLQHFFYGIPEIDLSNANFRNTKLRSIFVSGTRKVNLSGADFTNADMEQAFVASNHLETINLNNVITKGVTNMAQMFNSCGSLTSLDLSSFDTSKVTDMTAMFFACRSLTSLDLSSFDTSKVISMVSMFSSCDSLTNLDLSSFDTSKATKMGGMFKQTTNLTNIKVSNKWVIGSATTVEDMFTNCGTDHVTVV
ncbi:BspA family leucine-rich repeat surface protein [bacterium]|nr:BspA family leucine-rich repeat surface protein [bacterium]